MIQLRYSLSISLLLFVLSCYSQDERPKNEISISAGLFPVGLSHMISNQDDALCNTYTFWDDMVNHDAEGGTCDAWGWNVSVDYLHNISSRWGVGVVAGYSKDNWERDYTKFHEDGTVEDY